MLETYLKLINVCYFELGEAFKGLKDENVWKRPAPGLLSVGEISGHIAYWEALRLAGEGEDLSKCKVKSPLIDRRFRYYQSTLETPPSDEHLGMTAEQVHKELVRIHQESVAHFKALNPSLSSAMHGYPGNFTYGAMLEYRVFHIAYHTGQIYSARHLMGEETVDN
jgi:hypothetical protein